MGDAHGAVGGVDRLAARTARAEDVDAQILVVDLDVDLLGLGQDGDGGGRGVDAPGALGRGHALDAVDAGFEFEALEDVAAGDGDDRLLEAADAGLGDVHDLEAPALERGVALIHAEEIGGEERRFLAAGAGAQLEDGVALVGLVLGQQQKPHLLLELGNALAELGQLGLGQRAHLRLARLGKELRRDPSRSARARLSAAMPSTSGDSSLNSFDSLPNSPPSRAGSASAALSSSWRRTSLSSLASKRALAHVSSSSPSRNNRRNKRLHRRDIGSAARGQIAQRLRGIVQQPVDEKPRRRRGIEATLRHHLVAQPLEMTAQRHHRRHRATLGLPRLIGRDLGIDDAPGRGEILLARRQAPRSPRVRDRRDHRGRRPRGR